MCDALLEAVRALRVAYPDLGAEQLLAKLREQQPDLRAGTREVREALTALTAESETKVASSLSAAAAPRARAAAHRIDELRAAHPGMSTAELRAMAREDRIDELRAAHPGMSTAELLVARARARLT